MQRILLAFIFIGSFSLSWGQTRIYLLDFESSGGYTTSMPEQTDGSENYFIRTDGSNISAIYNSPKGSYYFAAQDLDADGMTTPATLNIDDINIWGYTDLELRIYIAEDDDGTKEDWDKEDYLHIDYDIDNSGTFSNGIWVENNGAPNNSAPFIDTDYDGVGDGTEITDTFTQFTKNLSGSGSLLDIKITFGGLVSNDEDIAIDHIEIWGISSGPLVDFQVTSATVSENATTYTLQVISNTTGSHTVDIITNGGTATNGTEYSFNSPIQADFTSSTTFTTDVTIIDNTDCNGNSNVIFELDNPSGCSIGNNNQLDLTIEDDEMETGVYKYAKFEGTDTWAYSSNANIESDINKYNDEHSLRLEEGNLTAEFENINISGFTDVQISVAYASTGVDSGEDLYMDISYDGGVTYTENILLVDGYSNLNTNINETNSHTANTNPFIFNVPSEKTSVRIKFRATNLDTNEFYYIDDVILSRSACLLCSEPTTDAVFHLNSPQNLTGTSATLNWTNGDGNNRIVIMRAGSPVSFVPADNTSYTASSLFGSGTDVGSGEYIVYNGNGNSVDITGLNPGTMYYATIYEYNCTAGNENYFTSGNPATDNFYTIPENPGTFISLCTDNSSIELSWTAPATGNYDGYLLVVREDAVPHSVNSLDPNTSLGENLDYTLAASYGSTSPNSRILYKGTGTSATVTGLTTGTNYTFEIFTYVANGSAYKYSDGSTLSRTIAMPEVTSATTGPDNEQLLISWNNPDTNCFDEIMVVANETAGIDFTPAGDGSAYTADSNYTTANQVVYKGTGTQIIVTGLDNGTTYYFEIFVRKGTQWSGGVEISGTPAAITKLYPGDLAILAVNTDISDGKDQIAFVCFKDILPGTEIFLTDNGFERKYAGEWGGTEGLIKITRTNSTLPKGTIIVFESTNNSGNVTQASHFNIYTCGNVDNNWDKYALSGTGIGGFNLNNDDDVWIMQGGTWTNSTDHHSQYSGNVLYGWTESGWDNLPPDGTDRGTAFSNLFPSSKCFTTAAPTGGGKVKFNNPNDPDFSNTSYDQLDWISLINDSDNWTSYSSNSDYENNGFDYKGDTTCPQLTITNGNHIAGKWDGSENTNWFDCANWDDLVVPSFNTDVIISASSSQPVIIDPNAPYSGIYNQIAQARNLTIETGQSLEMSGSATLEIYGDWDNQAGEPAFKEGNGKVIFLSSSTQNIQCNNGNETEIFNDLEINNSSGVNFASGNIHANGVLKLTRSPDITVQDGKYIMAAKGFENQGTKITVENQGNFIQTGETAGITGNGTYVLNKISQPLDQYYEYVYWSSPIQSSSLSLGEIVDNAWAYYEYDPGDTSYPAYPGWISKTETDTFVPALGYAISAPKGTGGEIILKPSFTKNKDPFNAGTITYTLRLSADNDAAGDDDYNLIGNPYPSALDFDKFAADNTNIEGAYYAWTNCAGLDADLHHQEQGYTVYSVGSGSTKACSNTGLEAKQHIATAQGFMVEAIEKGNIQFKNAHRSLTNDNFINKPANIDRFWLDLTNSEGAYNQILIAFSPEATNGYDRLFDAHYLESGNGQEFYSIGQNEKWTIQGLPLINSKEELIIPLGMKQAVETGIKIHLNKTEGNLQSMYIYLHDKKTGSLHLLNDSDYEITIDEGETKDRFEIILQHATLQNERNSLENNEISILQNESQFNIKSLGEKEINQIKVFLLNGQEILNVRNLATKNINLTINNLSSGNLLIFSILLDKKFITNIKYMVK